MEKCKLTDEDMKQIAHYIAQKEYSSQGGVESYLNEFNNVVEKLKEYNKSIK